MDRKRERSKNYLEEERQNLLTILEEYQHIVENKKTDAISSQTKAIAWEEIAKLYNGTAKTGTRNGNQLKLLYDNLKKTAKKHKADEKVEIYKTGGGSASSNLSTFDTRVLNILGSQVEGISNPYDSNTDFVTEATVEETVPVTPTVRIVATIPASPSTPTSVPSCSGTKQNTYKNFFDKCNKKKVAELTPYQREILKIKKEKHLKKMEILEIIKERESVELKLKQIELQEKQNTQL